AYATHRFALMSAAPVTRLWERKSAARTIPAIIERTVSRFGPHTLTIPAPNMRHSWRHVLILLTADSIRHHKVIPPSKNSTGNFFVCHPEFNRPWCSAHKGGPKLRMGCISPTKFPAVDRDVDPLKDSSRK